MDAASKDARQDTGSSADDVRGYFVATEVSRRPIGGQDGGNRRTSFARVAPKKANALGHPVRVGSTARPDILRFVYCAGSRSSRPRGQSGPTGISSKVIIPA